MLTIEKMAPIDADDLEASKIADTLLYECGGNFQRAYQGALRLAKVCSARAAIYREAGDNILRLEAARQAP